jgi:hypothetical protein
MGKSHNNTSSQWYFINNIAISREPLLTRIGDAINTHI